MSRDPDSSKVRFVLLIILIVCGIIFYPTFRSRDLQEKYDELQDKYDELEAKYDSISSFYIEDKEKLGPAYDDLIEKLYSVDSDIITLFCYFENDEGYTRKIAYDSFTHLDSVINSILYPD